MKKKTIALWLSLIFILNFSTAYGVASKIVSIANLTVKIKQKSTYKLPTTVNAKLSNGTYAKKAVKWSITKIDTSKVKKITVRGTVSGYNKKVILTINVLPVFESSIEHIDANTLYVEYQGEKLLQPAVFNRRAGISLVNSPLVYDSSFTFEQHMDNIAKFIHIMGGTLDVSSGAWDPGYFNREGLIGKNEVRGHIVKVGNSGDLSKYAGKVDIFMGSWRTNLYPGDIMNKDLNIVMEVYKYFLGTKAGEDLWKLIDYAYMNNLTAFPSKYNWTVKTIKKLPGGVIVDAKHSRGAEIVMEVPNNNPVLDVVVIHRGN